MSILTKVDKNWEHLYTQFKSSAGEPVLCMMHKETKKFVYFDVHLNRVLSKKEALIYRVDATGKYSAQMPVEQKGRAG